MSYNQKFQKELHDLYDSDPKFITKLLEYQIIVPLTSKDKYGNTILHKMIEKKDFKNIDLLLQNLNLNIYDNNTKLFLLNSKNDSGNTPVHIAVMKDLQIVAKQLDKAGADLSIPNSNDLVISMSDSETETNINIDSKNKLSSSKSNTNYNRNILGNNFELDTITSESQESNISVDTVAFIDFLKSKQLVEQNGGKQSKNSIKGKRNINNDNKINVDTATDSLGISHLIQEYLDNQNGGKKKKSKKVKSSRLTKSSESASSSSRSNLSRKTNDASKIHEDVVNIIRNMLPKLGNNDPNDAIYVKAGLYAMIKEKYPNLSNLQRANKLKDLTTEDEIKKILNILPKLKESVTKAREQRKIEKENSNKSVNSDDIKKVKSSKKTKETKETKPKKESKTKVTKVTKVTQK